MYIVRRHQTYWAMHDVPKALQRVHGRRLARSLETPDLGTAKRLAAVLWAHEWSRLMSNASDAKADEAEARFYASMLRSARSDQERRHLRDHIADLARERHDNARSDDDREAALRWNQAAQGKLVPTEEHLAGWEASLRDKPATVKQKVRIARLFADAFPYLQEVETRKVQAWLHALAKAGDMAAPTFDRHLSAVRGYWQYLVDCGLVEGNPLRDLQRPKSVRKVSSWQPFQPDEVVALLKAARDAGDGELASLIELGMWTGARIDELGKLKVGDVDLKRRALKITDSKTTAGIREVPIHPKLLKSVQGLIKGRNAGEYVLERPRGTGTVTRRSKAVGERFSTLKTKLGHGDRHVFHSLRKTVGTLLENAGVLENVAADILGHEKPRITYGIYSGGSSLEVKKAAIERIGYPR